MSQSREIISNVCIEKQSNNAEKAECTPFRFPKNLEKSKKCDNAKGPIGENIFKVQANKMIQE